MDKTKPDCLHPNIEPTKNKNVKLCKLCSCILIIDTQNGNNSNNYVKINSNTQD